MKKCLVTGVAGFIGCEVALLLSKAGYSIVGIDNLNHYYDVSLKHARLKRLNGLVDFREMDLVDKNSLNDLFKTEKFDAVVHLAAQAGVRYSLENPQAYVDSNVTGFLSILECCRENPVKHLVYASSSSVYAATKRSNELMAETYSHLFKVNSTGLRFFTVYGPWGRPDMAPWLFASSILDGKPIKVFNNGNMLRDFTYIADIAEGVVRVLENGLERAPIHKLYNIGHGSPVNLMDFIVILENSLGMEAKKDFLPMQPGDVEVTYADTSALEKEVGYLANTDLETGVKAFAEWFKDYKNSI